MMSQQQYYLHPDGKGRFLLQNAETGILEGLVFPGMPGESAHAFSRDYGSVWYPQQLLNLKDFPELADMPFFTIESSSTYYLDGHFKQAEPQASWVLLGSLARSISYSLPLDQRSRPASDPAPVLWQYQVVNPHGIWTIPILDVWVNEQGCWFCTREGQVIVVNHQGEMIQQYGLPKLTRCLAGREEAPYVSCEDGNFYDLTNKLPQVAGTVRPAHDFRYSYQILSLDQASDSVLVGDAYGYIRKFNADLDLQWQHCYPDHWQGWFLRSDGDRFYQGHYHGVSAYDLVTGEEDWKQALAAPVLCGCLAQDEVIVGCSDRGLYGLSKTADLKTRSITLKTLHLCQGMPYAVTLSADEQWLLVGDYSGKLECLDRRGNLKTALQLRAGAITALKIWHDRLYVATSQGVLMALETHFYSGN